MIVSIHQPSFFPWMGLLKRIKASDFHIFLDTVQFEKGSFVNRCQFPGSGDSLFYLTVPIKRGGDRRISELEFGGGNWERKHLRTFQQLYGGGKRLDEVARLYHMVEIGLVTPAVFFMQTTRFLLRKHRIATPCIKASLLNPEGAKSDLVLDICMKLRASVYLSGIHGRDYLDLDAFAAEGIEVKFHEYCPPSPDHGLSGLHSLMKGIRL